MRNRMDNLIRLVLVAALLVAFVSNGLVARSADNECPATPKQKEPIGQYEFLKAHGLTQDSFSIWLMEHSEWRRKYSKDLEQFSFIPQKDFETERQGE